MSFEPTRVAGEKVPEIDERDLAAGAAFNPGALLVVDANGDYAECGADPAAVAAVAANGAGADTTGFIRTGMKEFPPGRMVATLVKNNQKFRAKYVGTLPAADGGSYGVVLDADGDWKVDFDEVTTLVVKLVGRLTDAPLNQPYVEVVFLPGVVQVF